MLEALVDRTGIDPGSVDDVIIGCVGQVGEQAAAPGRQAWLAAGYPISVPSTTIERRCGSGQQALDFAVQGVVAGAYDVVIAGGLESMSHIPIMSHRLGRDVDGPRLRTRFPDLVPQGVSAELIAHTYGLTREQLDQYSSDSHARALTAQQRGLFDPFLTPIRRPDGSSFAADESSEAKELPSGRLMGVRNGSKRPCC